MNIEEALFILDKVLQQKFLNNVQELVFRQAWAGQTYLEMAESSGYNAHYIKDVGYKLWNLLSKALEEKVTKSNFRSVLRRRYFASQRHFFEGELLSDWKGENVFVRAGVSEASGQEIASPKAIAFGQEIGESQQTLVVNTVLATPLDTDEIKVNSQNTKTNLVRVTPNVAKATAANTRSDWGEVVDLSAFYGRTKELKTLKQWMVDALYRLIALLGVRGIGTVAVRSAEQIQDEFEYLTRAIALACLTSS